jgi:hypothetical protein
MKARFTNGRDFEVTFSHQYDWRAAVYSACGLIENGSGSLRDDRPG